VVEYLDPNQLKQMQQMQQLEEMKKKLLGKILSKEAFERLGRVRFANPELASQAELYLLQIYQSGRLKENVKDEEMKEILKLLSEKREFSIKKK
jgi:DNA-binding TFAR19-related protein (PDSD5 family)